MKIRGKGVNNSVDMKEGEIGINVLAKQLVHVAACMS